LESDCTTIKAAIGAQYTSGNPKPWAASNASAAAIIILAGCARLFLNDAGGWVFILFSPEFSILHRMALSKSFGKRDGPLADQRR
jgi:hypothetical protein